MQDQIVDHEEELHSEIQDQHEEVVMEVDHVHSKAADHVQIDHHLVIVANVQQDHLNQEIVHHVVKIEVHSLEHLGQMHQDVHSLIELLQDRLIHQDQIDQHMMLQGELMQQNHSMRSQKEAAKNQHMIHHLVKEELLQEEQLLVE
ncbi:MAG: hypothetical protein WCJ81_00125 [bacterium]